MENNKSNTEINITSNYSNQYAFMWDMTKPANSWGYTLRFSIGWAITPFMVILSKLLNKKFKI